MYRLTGIFVYLRRGELSGFYRAIIDYRHLRLRVVDGKQMDNYCRVLTDDMLVEVEYVFFWGGGGAFADEFTMDKTHINRSL